MSCYSSPATAILSLGTFLLGRAAPLLMFATTIACMEEGPKPTARSPISALYKKPPMELVQSKRGGLRWTELLGDGRWSMDGTGVLAWLDGRTAPRLIVAEDHSIRICDAQGRIEKHLFDIGPLMRVRVCGQTLFALRVPPPYESEPALLRWRLSDWTPLAPRPGVAAFDTDGNRVVLGSVDGHVEVREGGRLIRRWRAYGEDMEIQIVAMNPGQVISVAWPNGSNKTYAKLWDVTRPDPVCTLKIECPRETAQLAGLKDSFLANGIDGLFRLVGDQWKPVAGVAGPIMDICVTGGFVAVATEHRDHLRLISSHVYLLRRPDLAVRGAWAMDHGAHSAAYSEAAGLLASTSTSRVSLRSTRDGRASPETNAPGSGDLLADWPAPGKLLATHDDGSVSLWSIDDGTRTTAHIAAQEIFVVGQLAGLALVRSEDLIVALKPDLTEAWRSENRELIVEGGALFELVGERAFAVDAGTGIRSDRDDRSAKDFLARRATRGAAADRIIGALKLVLANVECGKILIVVTPLSRTGWDLTTGRRLWSVDRWPGKKAGYYCDAILAKGPPDRLVVYSSRGQLAIVDARTGRTLDTIRIGVAVWSLVVVRNRIWLACADGTLRGYTIDWLK